MGAQRLQGAMDAALSNGWSVFLMSQALGSMVVRSTLRLCAWPTARNACADRWPAGLAPYVNAPSLTAKRRLARLK